MSTAADILFPDLPSDTAPAPAAPNVTHPTAAAVQAAPVSEETADARLERLFGPDKPAAEAPSQPAAVPDFIDQAHPDAAAATPIVQELGLGRDQVAKLEALHTQMTAAAVERQSATWATEAQRLPPADIQDAQAAVAQFGSPELRAVLNSTGLGNHPAVIRAFAKALRSNPYRR